MVSAPQLSITKIKEAWDWERYARPEQLEPEGDWLIWLIKTGRGWGKTKTGSETTNKRVAEGRAGNIALVAPSAADARDVMVDEMMQASGILSCAPPWFKPLYQKSNRRLVWPNGAVATIYSAEDPDQLRGPQHDFAWCDEMAAWPKNNLEPTWSNLVFGLRQGTSQCIITTTPRPLPIFRRLMAMPNTVVTEGSTYDNIANLSRAFIEQNIKPYEGTRLGRQELLGQILDDNPEALWTYAMLDRNRVTEAPEYMDRVVVGVDPAGSAEAHEIGITVGGRARSVEDNQMHGFLLADYSMNGMPEEWALQVIRAYDDHEANCVVVERNYGGDMVKSTISLVARNIGHSPIAIRDVVATRGKAVRAEPISGLSSQGKIHHVGTHEGLEDQLCEFQTGGANDRVDSYVWTFTDLLVNTGARVYTY